ncbi:F-box protein At5g07610-like [Bidens hawaiensis]|uniref:F-box protein At5g07610-like n=1 Tax=Bidens hawaiensis TaxID=980011 RepID=UPI00404A116A
MQVPVRALSRSASDAENSDIVETIPLEQNPVRKRYNTLSADMICSNDNLLTEILARIPFPILGFKSVSKHWQRLISDRHFTRCLDFCPDLNGIKIVQSCNGLLLCCSERKYYVLNPTTKQFAIIPSAPGGDDIRFMGLAFHQTTCPHYKVVCILNINPSEVLFLIQIYSSDTREWKTISYFVDHDYLYVGSGVYWNCAIHWAPSCPNPCYFDLNLEQLQKLPLPMQAICIWWLMSNMNLVSTLMCMRCLGTIRGGVKYKVDLHDLPDLYPNKNESSSIYSRRDLEIIDFLEPSEYHWGWLVKYRVEPHGLFPDNILYRSCSIEVIDVVRGEDEEEDTFMVLKMQEKISG